MQSELGCPQQAIDTWAEPVAVCRSAFYAWQSAEPGVRQRELDELAPTIAVIFLKHRRRYGARRIAHELRDRGIVCSPRRVAKALKILGLHAICRRRAKVRR